MSGPFAYGVTALDEALLTLPVYKSEAGLSQRRSKLEWIAAQAFRAWLADAVDQGTVEADAVSKLLGEIPEFDANKRMIIDG